MKLKLRIFITILLALAGLLFITSTVNAAFDPLSEACKNTPNSPACQQPANPAENPILHIINVAITIIAFVAGVGAIIMIMLGAFFLATSGGSPGGQRSGDTNARKKAQARIVAGLVGLVIISFAYTIVRFVTHILAK